LASYNQSLANDELNVKSFGGRRDHWADLADEFPQYQRKASFLMIFAMFEDDLTQFCKAIAAEQKVTTALKDVPGKGMSAPRVTSPKPCVSHSRRTQPNGKTSNRWET
jgi:hypothetical protein